MIMPFTACRHLHPFQRYLRTRTHEQSINNASGHCVVVGGGIMKKTLQTNIAMNDPYDTRLS